MAIFDVILGIVLIILILRSALRGFVEESFSLAAGLLGMWVALLLYRNGANFIRLQFNTDLRIVPEILSFIILFFIVFGAIKLLQSMIKDIIRRINVGTADHFLGALFGILEGLTVAALVVVLFRLQPIFDAQPLLAESFFAKMFANLTVTPFINAVIQG
ncbi:putative membrane protein required for colicin V production [Pillotina sp. SPG140]|jgi:membrane protein required for colicin V production